MAVSGTTSSLLHAFAHGAVTRSDGASRAELVTGDSLLFRGEISLALSGYGGDCAAVRSAEGRFDLSERTGLAVGARGDGRTYRLRLRTSESFAGVHYEAELKTDPGALRDIQLPFAVFRAVSGWSEYAGHPPLDPALITSFGLAVPRSVAGPFALELTSLRGYRSPSIELPTERAPNADAWESWFDRVLWPGAREAAELPPSTRPTEVFQGASLRRAEERIPCYQTGAEVACEELLVVHAANTVARRAPGTVRACEAVVYLAMEAAYERAVALDLAAETGDYFAREAEAERVYARWLALAASIPASLREAGLEVDSVPSDASG